MCFLEYLFFKYYNWAIKVGDGDMPATTSVMCISFCIMIYVMNIFNFFFFFILTKTTIKFFSLYFYIFSFAVSFAVLYIILVSCLRRTKFSQCRRTNSVTQESAKLIWLQK